MKRFSNQINRKIFIEEKDHILIYLVMISTYESLERKLWNARYVSQTTMGCFNGFEKKYEHECV